MALSPETPGRLSMLVLVSGATAMMRRRSEAWLGELIVPSQGASRTTLTGRPWAMDNGAFTNFNAEKFLMTLEKFRGMPKCLFVAAPDVVADAKATGERFDRWARVIRGMGYPVAFVAQDGLTVQATPWADLDAVFIGGTTAWKLGREARTIAAYAAARGKWLHVGRVNSRRRLRIAQTMGADSIDGTGISKFPDAMMARYTPYFDLPLFRLS